MREVGPHESDGHEGNELSELMKRYARGDEAVFKRLYARMAPRLYRSCLRLAGGRPEADDLFQETFLRLHRARATYLEGANPMSWVFAIARSVHFDRLRYRRRHPEDLGLACDAAENDGLNIDERYIPEAAAHNRDLVDLVTAELQRMSEKNRAAYSLLREHNLSVEEAAAELGISQAAVKQRAHRACKHLRAAVGMHGWEAIDRRPPRLSREVHAA